MKQPKVRYSLKIPQGARVIDVDTGEYRVSLKPALLQVIALGSCIALVVYERKLTISGIAHIMLPGASPYRIGSNKYAENAIDALLDSVERYGAAKKDLEVYVVGGGNVLQEGDIPDRVIESVLNYLNKINLEIKGMRIGGIERRSVFLDSTTGDVFYTEGENNTKILLTKIEHI